MRDCKLDDNGEWRGVHYAPSTAYAQILPRRAVMDISIPHNAVSVSPAERDRKWKGKLKKEGQREGYISGNKPGVIS